MKHLKQTRPSNCGQAVIAMATGNTIEHVEKVMGKRGSTTRKDMRETLEKLGYRLGPTQRGGANKEFDSTKMYLLAMSTKAGHRHWVLSDRPNEVVHDPSLEYPMTPKHYVREVLDACEGRITSWASIEKFE